MSMREGLAQHQRLAAALSPHYVDADELTQAQLMTLALQYAGLVRFADAGPPEGWTTSWRDYFGGDETLVMAEILALRVHRRRARFDELLDLALAGKQNADADGDPDRDRDHAPVARAELPTMLIGGMVERLQHWSAQLRERGSPAGIDLGIFIDGVLDKLAPALRRALAFHAARPVWDARTDVPALLAEIGAALGRAPDAALRDDELRALYRTWFNQLAKAVEMIQQGAVQRMQASLASGLHDPGTGLLLAFVQLYARAQAQANRLTGRHLDFYYDEVLRMRPRGPARDSTYLVFEPGAPGKRIAIPAGAAFLAPAGRRQPDLVYEAREGLLVGAARLLALYTLFCERNPLTEPENRLWEQRHNQRVAYPTACRVASLPLLQPEAALATASLAPNPLFGAPRVPTASAPGQAARLGFALASNVLAMREGERTVHVTLYLGSERTAQGAHHDRSYAEARPPATLGGRLAMLAERMRESIEEVRYKVLRRMFTLALTGTAGWIAVPGYSATFAPAGEGAAHDALHLYFALGHADDAVVARDAAVHGAEGAGNCPLLRVELNSEGYLYPYGLLRGLPLVRAQIDVDVRGHRSLALYNQVGPLSAAAPFQAFGPLPARGSYLIVGSEEAACKRLTDAQLVFEWGGLPQLPGGLRTYYGGYEGEPYREPRCTLAVLVDGRWQPAEAQPQHPLFAAALASRRHPVAPVETVDLGAVLALARPVMPRAGDQGFAYGPGASNGFFRLTLDGPDFAFGHRDYPWQLARALTHNGQPRHRRDQLPLPNPPYTPVVERLALHYKASGSVQPAPSPSGEALLRLHPFGWEAARGGSEGGDLLLPPLEYAGNLFLGLADAEPGAPLTLFFHLVEDALPMAGQHAHLISWAYLAGDHWKALPPHAVLADSTHGFLRPGIVTLALPADLSRAHTVMPAGAAWLRVSCETSLNKFCQLYSVHPHALQVCRAEQGTGMDTGAEQGIGVKTGAAAASAPARIEAATIRRPRHAIPGLGRITQMVASGGGRLAEDRLQLRRRSAERLRHKGRAVTPEDYERLVLERFPGIDRVKCFPNLSLARRPDGGACPGHVLVVALPAFASQGHMSVLPRLNGDVVAQVQDFLAQRVGAGVMVEVANPFYQRIQVRCKVRLAAGVDQGWAVNKLDWLVSDYISPWNDAGNTSPFGWTIRQHDIESFLLAQPGVLAVTEFSMLSVSDAGSDRYMLTDTALPGPEGQPAPDLTPRYPWSVAVPIRRHAILVAGSEQSRIARRTGIGKLEIGSTFIISNEAGHDQTE